VNYRLPNPAPDSIKVKKNFHRQGEEGAEGKKNYESSRTEKAAEALVRVVRG
jgi:hypothetical protein